MNSIIKRVLSVVNPTGNFHYLLKLEAAIAVSNALGEIDVPVTAVAVNILESGAEDGNPVVALEGKADVLGALGEVDPTPLEGASRTPSVSRGASKQQC